MIHIMVDIEGMNKMPESHKTRIMQIAAVPFDEYGVMKNLAPFNEFADRSFPPHTVDNSETVEWWRSQPIWGQMQRKQDKYGLKPVVLIQAFNEWVNSIAVNDEEGKVTLWACHPEYDITAIYAYMVEYGIEPNWPFYAVRDYATVRAAHSNLNMGRVTHWADEDVVRQVDVLVQCCRQGWEL